MCTAKVIAIIISLWCGLAYWLAFVVNQNWKNKIYRLGKVDEKIPILQVTRSKSKRQAQTEIWMEKHGFKPGSRLGWKIVEAF